MHHASFERAATRRVQGHPNVAELLDSPSSRVLVFRHYPTTAESLFLRPRLTLAALRALLRGSLAGLDWVHSRGLVHGDVQRRNVFLTAAGEPVLGDFGSATPAVTDPEDIAAAGLDLQCPAYRRAGEGWWSRAVASSCQTDIWALALLCIELVAQRPFACADHTEAQVRQCAWSSAARLCCGEPARRKSRHVSLADSLSSGDAATDSENFCARYREGVLRLARFDERRADALGCALAGIWTRALFGGDGCAGEGETDKLSRLVDKLKIHLHFY
jgi:serine/threonine protein kinase